MEILHYAYFAVGVVLGVGLTLWAVCLADIGDLGSDPFPEVDVYTDASGKLRQVVAPSHVRFHCYQD